MRIAHSCGSNVIELLSNTTRKVTELTGRKHEGTQREVFLPAIVYLKVRTKAC
jgi:hypothetical protein